MDKVIELMDAACDKTTTPAYHNEFWTITQAELERFYTLARADLEAENEQMAKDFKELKAVSVARLKSLEAAWTENAKLRFALDYIQHQTHIGHIHDTASAALEKEQP